MSSRPPTGHLGQSPLEIIAVPFLLIGMAVIGVIWGIGVIIGSILGATLPGSIADGLVAMMRAFPDVGRAWEPAIPSVVIWAAAVISVGLAAPLVWKVIRAGRLREEGAQWASGSDLQRAGLLVSEGRVAHSLPETSANEKHGDGS